MKVLKLCLILLYFSIPKINASEALELNKIYNFVGESSIHGSYTSQLELRQEHSKISAIKIISYEDFMFEGLKIEEVWTGEAILEGAQLKIEYDLKKADFLNTAEGESRTPEMFTTKEKIIQQLSPLSSASTSTSTSFNRSEEYFHEKLVNSSDLQEFPLWQNLRQIKLSYGREASLLLKAAFAIVKARVFNWFHDDPKVKQWESKKEYQSKNQYLVTDPTGYKFYQMNHDILRVVNKVPDRISLVEEIQRRNAYSPSLKEKQAFFQKRMEKFHINELGLFSSPVVNSNNEILKYTFDDDSALWTGMYIASEAMRYKLSGDEGALLNIKKSLSGLMLLMDITNDNKNFARSAAIHDGSIDLNDKFHLSEEKNKKSIVWSSVGNNDMFKGLVHGLIWSYIVIPESDKELRLKIESYMLRIPQLNAASELQNKATAFGLKSLVSLKEEDLEQFIKIHQLDNILGRIFNVEGSMHYGGIVDWSGVNLGMVGTISNILITKELLKKFNNDKRIQKIQRNIQRSLVLQWKDLRSTKRDFLTIAAHTFALKDGFKLKNANELDDHLSPDELQAEWDKSLTDSVWSLREIPINRSGYDLSFDYSLKPDWSISWWPKLPWKSVKDRKTVDIHIQGAYAYPLFESFGMYTNFIWKDQAFNYKGQSSKSIKAPGSDYLYMYWMMKYGGLDF